VQISGLRVIRQLDSSQANLRMARNSGSIAAQPVSGTPTKERQPSKAKFVLVAVIYSSRAVLAPTRHAAERFCTAKGNRR